MFKPVANKPTTITRKKVIKSEILQPTQGTLQNHWQGKYTVYFYIFG